MDIEFDTLTVTARCHCGCELTLTLTDGSTATLGDALDEAAQDHGWADRNTCEDCAPRVRRIEAEEFRADQLRETA